MQITGRRRNLRRMGERERREASRERRAEERRGEQEDANAAALTAAGRSGLGTAESRQGGRTSQFTSGNHQGSEAVNHGFQPADVSFAPTHRDPIEAVLGPNQSSPPTRRGSVGSTQIGSNGSRRGSVGSTQMGSDESRDTVWMEDDRGNDGDQGGGGQATQSAMPSRSGNGAEGKKV